MLTLIPRHPQSIRTEALYQAVKRKGYRVSKRTVERNLVDLSSIFPLTTDTVGKANSWSWMKGAPAVQVPGMSAEEAMVFRLAQLHLERLLPASMFGSLRPYFATAERTLNALDSRSSKRRLLDRVRVVARGRGPVAEDVASRVKETILRGLLEQRKVALTYLDPRSDKESGRIIVSVQGIVQRMMVVMVVVTNERSTRPRSLRMHRIASARLLDEPAELIERVDLARFAYRE